MGCSFKRKKDITTTNAFLKALDESRRKTKKIWVEEASQFYKKLMKSKNVYNELVKEYNNSYHRTFNMKPVDVRTSTYFDFEIGSDKEDPNFEVGEPVRIPKYIYIFFFIFFSRTELY